MTDLGYSAYKLCGCERALSSTILIVDAGAGAAQMLRMCNGSIAFDKEHTLGQLLVIGAHRPAYVVTLSAINDMDQICGNRIDPECR